MTKVVIINEPPVVSLAVPTAPEQRKLANRVMEEAMSHVNISFHEISYIVATGYGRLNVPFADKQITEISCHARGVSYLVPDVRTIIDIGGQDSKAIKVADNRVADFVMNDKCAAGTGRFIEIIADTLGVPLEDMGRISVSADRKVEISSMCAVFAQHEVVDKLSDGVPLSDIIAGIHDGIAGRIYRMARKIKIEKEAVITGGGAKNEGLIKALEEKIGFPVMVPQEPFITGALGAALLAKEAFMEARDKGISIPTRKVSLQEARFFD